MNRHFIINLTLVSLKLFLFIPIFRPFKNLIQMKKLSLLILFCCLTFVQLVYSQQEVNPLHSPKMNYFSLSDVRLLDGDFKHIQDLTHEYLLTIEPDRLCSWFRREAGLTPKSQPYPGWESNHGHIIPGHILGFYLSSMAMMYETTKDKKIIDRLEYTLQELDGCQNAAGDGYLSAVINGRQVFENVVDGNYTVNNGQIDNAGEPTYIMNKIMLGLYGVYTQCDLPLAKKVLTRMADWFGESVLEKISEEETQKLLICEHGSLSESFVCVYEITGVKKYLTWAERLNDYKMLIPASEGKDILRGKHANCQIQKFTGFEYVYRFTNDKKYADAARFFWKTVVADHTWIMGGNSTGEYFFHKSEYEERVMRNGGPEACNSVNILRLTEALYQDFPSPEMIDYYERVLINHLLGAYEPETGTIAYMTKLHPGGFKTHSTKYNSFWCCTGTGFESPAKFQKMIYTYDESSIYVNLFIPSELKWKEKDITIRQTTKIPDEETTTLELKLTEPKKFTLKIRHPHWVKKGALSISINGKKIKTASDLSQFVEIERIWKDGDKIVVHLPMQLNVIPLTSSDKFISFTYGPVVLAAEVESDDLKKSDYWAEHDHWGRRLTLDQRIPLENISWLIGTSADILKNTRKISTSSLEFKTEGVGSLYDYTLRPFNRIHFSRYVVYFPCGNVGDIEKLRQEKKILDENTIDHVNIAIEDSEKAHNMESIYSRTNNDLRFPWRDATNGGYIMYNMKVLPNEQNMLYLSFLKERYDNQTFDIMVDGKTIKTLNQDQLNNLKQTIIVSIPQEYTKGKNDVTIKIHAKRKQSTAKISDLRLMRSK